MKTLLAKLMIGAKAARALLVVALVAITTLALIPQEEVPLTTLWDKADHALAFLVLGVLVQLAFPMARFGRLLAPALFGYGVLLELLQTLTPTRVGSVDDLLADAVGLLLAALCIRLCALAPARDTERAAAGD